MKPLVTQYHALDIKVPARGGYLYPFSKYDWVWRTHKSTQETSGTITVLNDSMQLGYLMGFQRIQQGVRFTYSIGSQGGKRPWFACPTCQRRVGVLYHADGLPFRCRICCDLVHPSQYRARDQSYGRKLRGISHREQNRLSEQCAVGT